MGLSRNNDAFVWRDASKPPGMSGIREVYVEAQPGSQLVAFEIEGQIPYIVASFASPNRGTLITLTLDDEGNFRVLSTCFRSDTCCSICLMRSEPKSNSEII